MRAILGIIKRGYDLYNSLPIFVSILPFIILYLMLFSPSESACNKIPNLGIVGYWENSYGDFHSVKVLKGEELPYGEKEKNYAFCATRKGMVIFGIYKDSNDQTRGSLRTSLKAFFPVRDCIDIEVKPDESGTYGKAVYAYLAAEREGIYIINITDPKMPQYIAGCDTPGSAQEVDVSGDYAFVADDDGGLQIIDISNKSRPVIIGSCDTPSYAQGVDVSGDYAFVADYGSGLQIIDISDKTNPVITERCITPGSARGVDVSGDYAFVADYGSGLQIIDISDKTNPVIAGGCETPRCAKQVTVSGDYAFVIHFYIIGYSGLQIIDISNKNSPKIVGSYYTSGNVQGVDVSGDYALVAACHKGLKIIDISDKTNPVIAGGCDTPGYANGVTVSGDYAFVADGDNGLLIFKINFEPSPKANLILLTGGGISQMEEYWNLSRRISNGIFNTFIDNGYEVYDIYYLTSGLQDVDDDGVPDQMAADGLNEKTELESIIKELPDGHISNMGPLYLALIGHGAEDQFQIRMDGDNIQVHRS